MLKVTNLNYTVDGTQILHDVSLEVHPGEFVGILGPNGSGKSTLLKNIYKVLKPQSGAIELQGKNLLAMSNREMAQHLAVVGQEHEGSFDFLVEEVVLMGCQARKRLTEGFDESDRQAAMKALRRVILDEPTNHLDIGSQIKTLHLLKSSGKTVVAALHDLSIAAKYCDRVYVLQNGKNVVSGVPAEIITPELIHRLYDIDAALFTHRGELYLEYRS